MPVAFLIEIEGPLNSAGLPKEVTPRMQKFVRLSIEVADLQFRQDGGRTVYGLFRKITESPVAHHPKPLALHEC